MLNAIKYRIKHSAFWIRLSHSWTYQKLRKPHQYFELIKELDFYKSIIGEKNLLIFDVGANIGNKAMVLEKLTDKIVLFEPDKRMQKILRARYGGNPKFSIESTALGSKQETREYYVMKDNEAYNTFNPKQLATIREKNDVSTELAQTSTLDYYIAEYGKPDYIKIDVEGFEEQVIKGLTNRINIISFEANVPEFREETIGILHYLDNLAAYRYNYSVYGGPLMLKSFTNCSHMIKIVEHSTPQSLEIYCSLKH